MTMVQYPFVIVWQCLCAINKGKTIRKHTVRDHYHTDSVLNSV